ncbi:hypothetical protein C8A05DRAFT_32282 [Staphylotrichum tortipilum]|uniref:Peroxin/Ferlin domain-containing protein n=1 Tax=Staphylotrichum tortipilum TaxID=2831512 RepID=A0AAN6MP68_9PEZI|nr:hypothetical protein C8A05DRAFT_32282 [Staphylotrichum longicolle]
MPKINHHRSSRRVPPPTDSDFDHEIDLVDQDDEGEGVTDTRPPTAGPSPSQHDGAASSAAGPLAADAEGGPGGDGSGEEAAAGQQPSVVVVGATPQVGTERPKSVTQTATDVSRPRSAESAIDILYENQRGGFLCGMALFSSMALGNLDPPAWTNYAHRPSPTDVTTAQVPDPSWEWAWPEWQINHDEGMDEDGWEYSFAFAKGFSWHKAQWWNSFVRRRAWIRKRVKKNAGYIAQDPLLLNPEYFSVRPSSELARDRSPSRASSVANVEGTGPQQQQQRQPEIEDIDELLRVLRESRIDREKIEAVDNYLANARDNLRGLEEIMHEIMALFVFQASRRVLLSKLTEVYDKASADSKNQSSADPGLDERVRNLAAAVKHADEEVRRLEYWSDVKGMAEEGSSKGAPNGKQGWDPGADKCGGPAALTIPQQGGIDGQKEGEGKAEGKAEGNAKAKASNLGTGEQGS